MIIFLLRLTSNWAGIVIDDFLKDKYVLIIPQQLCTRQVDRLRCRPLLQNKKAIPFQNKSTAGLFFIVWKVAQRPYFQTPPMKPTKTRPFEERRHKIHINSSSQSSKCSKFTLLWPFRKVLLCIWDTHRRINFLLFLGKVVCG